MLHDLVVAHHKPNPPSEVRASIFLVSKTPSGETMKIDSYTKFLLTVVTICLVYLSMKSFLAAPTVKADAPIRVILVDGMNRPISGPIVRSKDGTAVTGFGSPLIVRVTRP